MSKDIPIIFSAPMVRAIIEGRKSQTRRVLRAELPASPGQSVNPHNEIRHDAPYLDAYCSERKTAENPRGMSRNWCWWTRDDRQCLPTINVRYQPGDRLWVREAWKPHSLYAGMKPAEMPKAKVFYLADDAYEPSSVPGRPSIHMPRWASRLTLAVRSVKIERLQDISDDDCRDEGVLAWRASWAEKQAAEMFLHGTEAAVETREGSTPKRLFYLLWRSLHGIDSWRANPFVVAVTFRTITANIDSAEAKEAA